jgi:hypothetical protein
MRHSSRLVGRKNDKGWSGAIPLHPRSALEPTTIRKNVVNLAFAPPSTKERLLNARLRTVWAIAIAVSVVAIGCGNDDESSSASGSGTGESSSLTKAEFVKKANAACTEEREGGFERIAAYTEKHRSEGLPEALLAAKALKVTLLSMIGGELDALRQLEAPLGDEKEVEAMLTTIQAELEKAKEVKLRPELPPEAIEDKFPKANKLIRSYGLTSCIK